MLSTLVDWPSLAVINFRMIFDIVTSRRNKTCWKERVNLESDFVAEIFTKLRLERKNIVNKLIKININSYGYGKVFLTNYLNILIFPNYLIILVFYLISPYIYRHRLPNCSVLNVLPVNSLSYYIINMILNELVYILRYSSRRVGLRNLKKKMLWYFGCILRTVHCSIETVGIFLQ